jgi:hypothetical protein
MLSDLFGSVCFLLISFYLFGLMSLEFTPLTLLVYFVFIASEFSELCSIYGMSFAFLNLLEELIMFFIDVFLVANLLV